MAYCDRLDDAVQPLFVNVIAPIFNKFEPLSSGEPRDAIESFAKKVDFPIGRIDVMDGSRRSAHSNDQWLAKVKKNCSI